MSYFYLYARLFARITVPGFVAVDHMWAELVAQAALPENVTAWESYFIPITSLNSHPGLSLKRETN